MRIEMQSTEASLVVLIQIENRRLCHLASLGARRQQPKLPDVETILNAYGQIVGRYHPRCMRSWNAVGYLHTIYQVVTKARLSVQGDAWKHGFNHQARNPAVTPKTYNTKRSH